VIRGDDHVNNTPRQINVLRALGAALPRYGHVPMIHGPDGQKLSKRHGAVSVMQYDADGFLPEALERLCAERRPRAIYVVPALQNPTATTMPLARRRAVAEIVRASGTWLIEDDPYSRLFDAPVPAMASLAPERSFHLATLSKCLSPGLRTAFLAAPPGPMGEAVAASLRAVSLMPAPLMTAVAARWIREGTAQALLDGVRREAAERQVLAREILPATMQAHPHALHVWQPLPAHWARDRLIERAREAGLGVMAADAFSTGDAAPDAIRIALGAIPERARLAEALGLLAGLIRDGG